MTSPGNGYVLMIMNGPEDGRVFEIYKERVSIGATEGDDIFIGSDPSILKEHAFLVWSNNQFTLVKNLPFTPSNMFIQPGQCFTVGETELLIKLKYQL